MARGERGDPGFFFFLINGWAVMKRRYQRSMKGERRREQSINPTSRPDRERASRNENQRKEGSEGGREEEAERKIASRLCSVKGEITHLRRFFQATTGSIDQTAGFMSQFSTWNIDTENPFYPCLLAFPHSFFSSLSLYQTAHSVWMGLLL